MWTLLDSPIAASTVNEITREANEYATMREDRHFVAAGKQFFHAGPTTPQRLPLLKAIHDDIAREVPFAEIFEEPVIDHA